MCPSPLRSRLSLPFVSADPDPINAYSAPPAFLPFGVRRPCLGREPRGASLGSSRGSSSFPTCCAAVHRSLSRCCSGNSPPTFQPWPPAVLLSCCASQGTPPSYFGVLLFSGLSVTLLLPSFSTHLHRNRYPAGLVAGTACVWGLRRHLVTVFSHKCFDVLYFTTLFYFTT